MASQSAPTVDARLWSDVVRPVLLGCVGSAMLLGPSVGVALDTEPTGEQVAGGLVLLLVLAVSLRAWHVVAGAAGSPGARCSVPACLLAALPLLHGAITMFLVWGLGDAPTAHPILHPVLDRILHVAAFAFVGGWFLRGGVGCLLACVPRWRAKGAAWIPAPPWVRGWFRQGGFLGFVSLPRFLRK